MKVGIHLELDARTLPANADAVLTPFIARACALKPDDIRGYRITKRSLDARQKPRVKILYAITADLRDGAVPQGHLEPPAAEPKLVVPENCANLRHPLVVGAGPAGLFAALILAQAGAQPVVIERGRDVDRRRQDIDAFFATRQLNPESNLLFGEGGAGTWSDGKLFTRVKDPRGTCVLQTFVDAGAPPEILYYAHPHLGSDRLPGIIAAIRERIRALGGSFLWDTVVTDIEGDGSFRALRIADGSRLEAPAALIACGHSARILLQTLAAKLDCSLKGFQLGCRIEHPQTFINRRQYGMDIPCPALGAAEYLFSVQGEGNAQGATTFCMCPGGEILPATCEPDSLCTNGMSNAGRDGAFANSAIITTLDATTFSSPAQAFNFLHRLETAAFQIGGGDYTAPAQRARDFLDERLGQLPATTSYRLGLTPARLDRLTPQTIRRALAHALRHFDRLAPGFINNGTLIGLETRVSSPVRFARNPETLASSMAHLYLAGEGGGMAGGIVSAAIDGIRLAEKMLQG